MGNINNNKTKFYNATHYASICKDNYDEFNKCLDELSKIENKIGNTQKLHDLRSKQQKSGTTVIVFAAICLEAFINDYASMNLSKQLFEKIEMLKPCNKWVIVPKLVTGKEFDTGSKAFELLRKLIKNRNELVHPKPKIIYELEKENEKKQLIVKEAYKTMSAVIRELDKVDNQLKLGRWAL
jgi:hypothetical protein